MQRSNHVASNNTNSKSQQIIHNIMEYLQGRITVYISENTNDKLRTSILRSALSVIDNMNAYEKSNSISLDLYFTVNSIFNICNNSNDVQAALRQFFADRENFLRGDSFDYCYRRTPANRLCQEVAKLAFPKQPPMNVLLHKAMTENRGYAWRDETSLDEDLESPGSFFRTNDNCIHLYEAVIDRAISNLNRGNYEMENIWFGTDQKNLNPLSQQGLNTLKQRSKVLQQFISYTEDLATNTGTVTQKFVDLQNGLANGSSSGYAGSPAYIAMKNFFNWWNNLDHSANGQALKLRMSQSAALSNLVTYLNNLAVTKDVCCVSLSSNLANLLTSQVRDILRNIDTNPREFFSANELAKFKEKIMADIENGFHTITTDRNSFHQLAKSQNFIQDLSDNAESMTYDGLRSWLEIISEVENARGRNNNNTRVRAPVVQLSQLANGINQIMPFQQPIPQPINASIYGDIPYYDPGSVTTYSVNANALNTNHYNGGSTVYNNNRSNANNNSDEKQISKVHSFFRTWKENIKGTNNYGDEKDMSRHHHFRKHRS